MAQAISELDVARARKNAGSAPCLGRDGIYRRALYLREAAKTVCEQGVPASEDGWLGLKGVGPYTAAAVYAFVSQKPSFAIDTNIRRVVGRLMLGIPYPHLDDDARVLRALKRLLRNPGEWKALHAFMDLGSMVCTSRKPVCAICPLRDFCPAAKKFEKGIPQKKKHRSREKIHEGKKYPDRIYRGRILAKLRDANMIRIDRIGLLIDSDFDITQDQPWMLRMLDRMSRDGLLVIKKNTICIPT